MYRFLKFDCSSWMCWICSDGKRFSTYTRADMHEREIRNK